MSRYERYRNNRIHSGEPCHYCKIRMISTKIVNSKNKEAFNLEHIATIDHVIPKSLGGTDDVDNIVISCQRCNNLKGNISYEIFFEFARVVIRQYPDAPIYVLRLTLRQFIDSLAEIAIRNRTETKRALSLSLLKFGQEITKA